MKTISKIPKATILSVLSLAFFTLAAISYLKQWGIFESLACLIFPLTGASAIQGWQDVTDTTNWQKSLRAHWRGGFFNGETYVRISFAYLYRIIVDGEYFLVKNSRGIERYQPVGGAYKCNPSEMKFLSGEFFVVQDEHIPIDDSSRHDYRMKVKSKDLKRFFKRFDQTTDREMINDLSREFREEVIKPLSLDFKEITYRYCGRDITNVEFSKFSQCYEILLADIIELMLTDDQYRSFQQLKKNPSEYYRFATSDQIKRCGVVPGTSQLAAYISEHSFKILQCHGSELVAKHGFMEERTIKL